MQIIAPLLVISFIAVTIGIWFARQQVLAVSAVGAQDYPGNYFLLTSAKVYFTVLCVFLANFSLLNVIAEGAITPFKLSLAYAPLLFIPLGFPILYALLLSLSLVLMMLLVRDKRQLMMVHFRVYRSDYLALLVFIGLNLLLTSRFSPLFWGDALLAEKGFNSEEVAVLAPVFKGYVLAKQYSFSFIDHAQWAGIMHPPGNLNSPLMQLLVLIFDLPSVSYYDFHATLLSLFFAIGILGSMGSYLLLKYSFKVSTLFSIFGGLLFFFGGAPLMDGSFATDAGIFLPPQALFPWVLLLTNASYDKGSYKLAAYVGVALAAQFFILTPHPEGTIYMMGSYLLYSIVMFLVSNKRNLKMRLLLATIPLLVFTLLSLFYLGPVMVDRFTGNMYVFAHTGDVTASNLRYIKRYLILALLAIPYLIYTIKDQKQLYPQTLALITVSLSLIAFTLLTMNVGFSLWLIKLMHIGLHFWVPTRLGLYLVFTVIMITIIAADLFAKRTEGAAFARFKKLMGKA